jgi:hypothetical protein
MRNLPLTKNVALKEDPYITLLLLAESQPRLAFVALSIANVGCIPSMLKFKMMWWYCDLHWRSQRLSAPRNSLLTCYWSQNTHTGRLCITCTALPDIGRSTYINSCPVASSVEEALYTYFRAGHMFRCSDSKALLHQNGLEVVTNRLWCVCASNELLENLGLAAVTWIRCG